MTGRRVPARTLRRRFTLGSGPLKRTSDRVEFLSRVVFVLALLLATPLGLEVGAVTHTGVAATAARQAASRFPETATLVTGAPRDATGAISVPARATWTAPGGAVHTGEVDASPGATAGSAVPVWVDQAGRITQRPLTDGEVLGQGVVVGVLAALGVVIVGMTTHLVVLWLLEGRRSRRWGTGWASVEPLWASRFG